MGGQSYLAVGPAEEIATRVSSQEAVSRLLALDKQTRDAPGLGLFDQEMDALARRLDGTSRAEVLRATSEGPVLSALLPYTAPPERRTSVGALLARKRENCRPSANAPSVQACISDDIWSLAWRLAENKVDQPADTAKAVIAAFGGDCQLFTSTSPPSAALAAAMTEEFLRQGLQACLAKLLSSTTYPSDALQLVRSDVIAALAPYSIAMTDSGWAELAERLGQRQIDEAFREEFLANQRPVQLLFPPHGTERAAWLSRE